MATKQTLIEFMRSLPSPEGCGCKDRKEATIEWLETGKNPFNAIVRSFGRIVPPALRPADEEQSA